MTCSAIGFGLYNQFDPRAALHKSAQLLRVYATQLRQKHVVYAEMIGLSLTYALPIASILNGLLTSSAETEQELVAVERTLRYTDHVPAEVRR